MPSTAPEAFEQQICSFASKQLDRLASLSQSRPQLQPAISKAVAATVAPIFGSRA